MIHTLVALVEDKPGVLSRVSSLFRRRGINIISFTVARTEQPGVSRLTTILDSDHATAMRLTAYFYKLVDVIHVEDLTEKPMVSRDLALIKVPVTPENRAEVMQVIEIFRARIVDMSTGSIIVEITGDDEKIDGFLQVLTPLGVIEIVRTGSLAMGRGLMPLGAGDGNGNGKLHGVMAVS